MLPSKKASTAAAVKNGDRVSHDEPTTFALYKEDQEEKNDR